MKNTQTARRYATALMRAAQSRSAIDEVYRDMETLLQMINESAEFRSFLTSPVIPQQKKKEAFTRLFAASFDALSMEFLKMLCSKRREMILPEMITEFKIQYRNHRGILQVEVTSVQDFEPGQVEALGAKLEEITGRKPEFRFVRDDALIAGFKIQIGDRVIDGSVRRQLDKLRKKLTETRMP